MELTIADAAARLGVSTREAQRLAQEGQLQVIRRVGRSLLVDDSSVAQRIHTAQTRGRRWSPATFWAAVELLEHGHTDRLTGSARSRLKRRLASITAEDFARLAAGRARTRRMTRTRRRPADLEAALVVSGRSALKDQGTAARFGLAAGGTEDVEGYLRRADLQAVMSRFGLFDDADGEVFLHVGDEDAVASDITVALDLIERGTTRERSAGLAVLREALGR
ncbi:helix-turn-helix domain-containing protein [Kocuria sp. M1R5S2]|uniref:helix-turn-helix domain-containing protein n=1 Tax=Kocuria rhizosphaerae TaxID=3376285 RepID=UPI003796AC5D